MVEAAVLRLLSFGPVQIPKGLIEGAAAVGAEAIAVVDVAGDDRLIDVVPFRVPGRRRRDQAVVLVVVNGVFGWFPPGEPPRGYPEGEAGVEVDPQRRVTADRFREKGTSTLRLFRPSTRYWIGSHSPNVSDSRSSSRLMSSFSSVSPR